MSHVAETGNALTLELLIPRSAMEPRSRCHLCGTEIPADQPTQFMRHVKACRKRNADQMEAAQARRMGSMFLGAEIDPELAAHIRKGGR